MRRLWLILIGCFLFSVCALAAPVLYEGYELPVDVEINGTRMAFYAYLDDTDRVFVPLRALAEALRLTVQYDDSSKTAQVSKGDARLCVSTAPADNSVIYAPLKNNAYYVPIRYMAEKFGCTVSWQADTYTVLISVPDLTPVTSVSPYSSAAIKEAASLVVLEAGSEPFAAQIGVANVLFNRVASKSFPSTLHGVIYDNAGAVQFPPAFSHSLSEMTPKTSCLLAVRLAASGITTVGGALYFSPAGVSSWAASHKTYRATLGRTAFYE